jgi:hypothetical protein
MSSSSFPYFSCRKHANPSQNASRRPEPVSYFVVRPDTVTFFAKKVSNNAAVQVAANWSQLANALILFAVCLSHRAKASTF